MASRTNFSLPGHEFMNTMFTSTGEKSHALISPADEDNQ